MYWSLQALEKERILPFMKSSQAKKPGALSPLGRFLIENSDERGGLSARVIHEAQKRFYLPGQGNILWRLDQVENYAKNIGLFTYPSWVD